MDASWLYMEKIRWSVLFGFLGFLLPALVMLISYPIILNQLGPEKFGVFILATSLSSALVLLDFGTSAAAVKFVAEDLGKKDIDNAAQVVSTSLVLYMVVGLLGASLIWFFASYARTVFSIDASLSTEVIIVFQWAAIQFAATFLITLFLAIFKAFRYFKYASIVTSTMAILTYGLASIALTFFDIGLSDVSMLFAVGTSIIFIGSAWSALVICRKNGLVLEVGSANISTVKRMLRFSAFFTINNLSQVLVSHLQRIVIGIVLGPAAVAIFATATVVVAKVNAVINAMFEVMMPVTSSLTAHFDHASMVWLRKFYWKAIGVSALVGVLGMGSLYFFSPFLIGFWLGSSETNESIVLLVQIFCLGFVLNSMTPVIFHMINGLGRPEINTVFFMFSPAVMYSLIYLFSFDGLKLIDFGIAQALAIFVSSLFYLLFAEIWMWRVWIPRMLVN